MKLHILPKNKTKRKPKSVNQHFSHCSDVIKDNTGAKFFLSISRSNFYNQVTHINHYLIFVQSWHT